MEMSKIIKMSEIDRKNSSENLSKNVTFIKMPKIHRNNSSNIYRKFFEHSEKMHRKFVENASKHFIENSWKIHRKILTTFFTFL